MSFAIVIIIMLIFGILGGIVNYILSKEATTLPANVPENENAEPPAPSTPVPNVRSRTLLECAIIGIGATILVPILLQTTDSRLLDRMHLGYSWKAEKDTCEKPKDKIQAVPVQSTKTKEPTISDSSASKSQPKENANIPAENKNQTTTKEENPDPLKAYLLFAAYCFLAAAAGVRFINLVTDGVLKDRKIEKLEIDKNVINKQKEKEKVKAELMEVKKEEAEKKNTRFQMQNRINLEEEEGKVKPETIANDILGPVERNINAPRINKPNIGRITVEDDPQKGRFGGLKSNNGRELFAEVTKSRIPDFYNVRIWVQSVNNKKLSGQVVFYLHDTFSNPVRIVTENDFENGRAEVSVKAWGAFTVGAVCDGGMTLLEYDLAEDVQFPEDFRNR